MAALLVAMTGCQKEPQVTPDESFTVDSYVSVNISLPNSVATRANDNFDDGEAEEYYVKNITLVFYDASGNYVSKAAVTSPWTNQAPSTDNITSTANTGAVKVASNVSSVLVLLNAEGVLDAGLITSATYGAFNAALTKEASAMSGTNNFLMTSVPVYNGDKTEFTSLVSVTPQKTEIEAIAAAADVQVERVVAKVQVDHNGTYTNTGVSVVKVEGWNLDITNTKMFPTRKVGLAADNWFTGSPATSINSGLIGATSKRIYYAVDPNYASTSDFSQFNKAVDSELTLGDEAIAYCNENTFAISDMTQKQSTRVLLKAKYIPEGFTDGETWYQVGTSKTIYRKADLQTYIMNTLNTQKGTSIVDPTTINIPTTAGSLSITHLTHDVNALIGDVICYAGGVCYYPIIIRHFVDTELDYSTTPNTFAEVYEAANGEYRNSDLGRYGVVRNNWYKINVNSIKNPGLPTITEPENTNDDELEQFVSCDIEILAWCLRDQTVDL